MAKRKKPPIKEPSPARALLSRLDPDQRSRLARSGVKLAACLLTLAAIVLALHCLDGYVKNVAKARDLQLTIKLLNVPHWVGPSLSRDICLSSGVRSDDFILDKQATTRWHANLSHNPWVKHVRHIHRRYDGLVELDCELRRPIASVSQPNGTFYLDADGVVLPRGELAPSEQLVQLRGDAAALPEPGSTVNSAALLAGLQVLAMIRCVDEDMPEPQRLWSELAILDVSNYQGRSDLERPHLKLYTTNDTEIRWGAAVGQARPWHEAPAKDKLSMLYRTHSQTGTLQCYKYIELRDAGKQTADPLRSSSNTFDSPADATPNDHSLPCGV